MSVKGPDVCIRFSYDSVYTLKGRQSLESSFVGVHVRVRRYWRDHYCTILVLYMATVSVSCHACRKTCPVIRRGVSCSAMGREGRGGLCCLCWGFPTLNKWIPFFKNFNKDFYFLFSGCQIFHWSFKMKSAINHLFFKLLIYHRFFLLKKIINTIGYISSLHSRNYLMRMPQLYWMIITISWFHL